MLQLKASSQSRRVVKAVSDTMAKAFRFSFPLILATILLADWRPARADEYPSETVRLILPFSPGGPTDIAARMVADALTKKWGQSVIVENRPGGATVIGTASVARAKPDGYTLLFGPSSGWWKIAF